MLRGADQGLGCRRGPALVITTAPPPDQAFAQPAELLVGDHPSPGRASHRVAERLATWLSELPPELPLLVLLSGGTSSLIGAPRPDLSTADWSGALDLLHSAGLDIRAMNAVRRRLMRWGGGRMVAALGARPTEVLLVSDVPQDDPATIGSGPLIGYSAAADDLSDVLAHADLVRQFPAPIRHALATAPRSTRPIPHRIIVTVTDATTAIAGAAGRQGVDVTLHPDRLLGSTRYHADQLSAMLAEDNAIHPVERLDVWASEMTVALPAAPGLGGRCQQFALEFALALESQVSRPGIADLLALSSATDGRDGPTDAAGGWSDAALAARIRQVGIDPLRAAEHCDAGPALARAGARYRTGPTGTNVADLVLVSRVARLE